MTNIYILFADLTETNSLYIFCEIIIFHGPRSIKTWFHLSTKIWNNEL